MGIMRQEGLRGAFLPNRKQKLEMVKSRNAPRPVRRHFIVYEYEGGKFCMIRSWHKPYRGVTCHTFLLREYHLSGQCTAPRKNRLHQFHKQVHFSEDRSQCFTILSGHVYVDLQAIMANSLFDLFFSSCSTRPLTLFKQLLRSNKPRDGGGD